MKKRNAFEIQTSPLKRERGIMRENERVTGVVGRVWDVCAEWEWKVYIEKYVIAKETW